jgi:hypothetical protein
MMDDASVKESRVALRLVQEHLLAAHALAGCNTQGAGMVDLVTHPSDASPHLNYVLPRRNTAWVPTPAIEQGLARLGELGREPRFQYIEGLFPPQFGDTLTKINLQTLEALPVLAFRLGGIIGNTATYPPVPSAGDLRARRISPERGAVLWTQSEWQTPIAGTLGSVSATVMEIAAYRQRNPVGVLRLEVQPDHGTAQLVRLALSDAEDADAAQHLMGAGVRLAIRHRGPLVFAMTGALAQPLETLGFVELGRLVTWMPTAAMEADHERMG